MLMAKFLGDVVQGQPLENSFIGVVDPETGELVTDWAGVNLKFVIKENGNLGAVDSTLVEIKDGDAAMTTVGSDLSVLLVDNALSETLLPGHVYYVDGWLKMGSASSQWRPFNFQTAEEPLYRAFFEVSQSTTQTKD